MTKSDFWKTKPFTEMTRAEWESLCDGCAKCCLIKLEDEDSGELHTTNIVCRHLDLNTCRCTCYRNRSVLVPDCVTLTPQLAGELNWMPVTCAYRLLAEGKELPGWHPLVSGDPGSVHREGKSVMGKVIPEDEADDPITHIVDWPV